MNPIELLLVIALGGFVVWLISLIPMPEVFKKVFYGVAIFILIVYVLQAFGVISGSFLRFPRVH